MSNRSSLASATLFAMVATFAVAWSGLHTPAFTDYELEAEPALDLLRAGHLQAFFTHAPAYGGSLLLRAPFALAPDLWGGGSLAVFRSMAAPGLLAAAALGLGLFAILEGEGRSRAAWLSLVLCVASPVTLRSLDVGHPEEVLGAAMLAAAALAALRDRPVLCATLLGLAIVNKAWAVLAIVPLLLALRHGRMRALLLAGTISAAGVIPFLLGASQALSTLRQSAHSTGTIFQPWQLWWFSGSHDGVVVGYYGQAKPGFRVAPEWAATMGHRMVILLPLLLAVAVVSARRLQRTPLRPVDAIALLVLSLLLRCVLDPWNTAYYEIPFLLTLLVWELQVRRGPPLLSAAATAAVTLTMVQTGSLSPDAMGALYLAWALPAVAALSAHLLAPAWTARVAARLQAAGRRRLPGLARTTAAR